MFNAKTLFEKLIDMDEQKSPPTSAQPRSEEESSKNLGDFREKFKQLLQLQMEALIFRSKIPDFDNAEVDELFEKMEHTQEQLVSEYSIEPKTEKPEYHDISLRLLAQRVNILEKKMTLILDRLSRIEKKIDALDSTRH